MKKIVPLFASVVAIAGLCGCGDSNVDLVRQGTLNGLEKVTIGKAFESAFGEGQWNSFESEKGTQVVEFNGKVGGNYPLSATEKFVCADSLKVQFIINADGKSFELAHISRSPDEVFEYAYSESGIYSPLKCITIEKGEFTDERDGKKYGYQTMPDEKVWMTENLRYESEIALERMNSRCYGMRPENCEKYGVLYTWEVAKIACPSGWHLPNIEEWKQLAKSAEILGGGERLAGKLLKSTKGWFTYDREGNGIDAFGFSALPAGEFSIGRFEHERLESIFWSSSEDESEKDYAYYLSFSTSSDFNAHGFYKTNGYSVRCVRN